MDRNKATFEGIPPRREQNEDNNGEEKVENFSKRTYILL